MRKLVTLAGLTVIAIFLAAAPPASAITIAQWAAAPVTVGDKVFTLISTTWANDDNITISLASGYYYVSLSPLSTHRTLTNTTKTLVYKVTIIDDPATPENEFLLNWFSQVSGDGNRYIASGTFTVTGLFDDNSDFSSPLTTFSNSGTPWGPNTIPGTVKQLYVSLTFVASGGSTILTSYTVTFSQEQEQISTEPTDWGAIKALYR
jgi:hypothetical protein